MTSKTQERKTEIELHWVMMIIIISVIFFQLSNIDVVFFSPSLPDIQPHFDAMMRNINAIGVHTFHFSPTK